MAFNDLCSNSQTKAYCLAFAGSSFVDLIKAFENVLQLFWRNTGPCVGHGDFYHTWPILMIYSVRAAFL